MDSGIAASVPPADPANTLVTLSSTGIVDELHHKEEENLEYLPGFIFLCSGKTKPECYRYRVFGLPRGRLEVVEKIKPGSKLFLFDFELKLLYGVYEATSTGEIDLEPFAFSRKFPVQVKFTIHKECLPLPENFLRQAIKENYVGNKFKPELTEAQVRELISLFRPLEGPSSSAHEPSLPFSRIPRSMPVVQLHHQDVQLLQRQQTQNRYGGSGYHQSYFGEGGEFQHYPSRANPGRRNFPAGSGPYYAHHTHSSDSNRHGQMIMRPQNPYLYSQMPQQDNPSVVRQYNYLPASSYGTQAVLSQTVGHRSYWMPQAPAHNASVGSDVQPQTISHQEAVAPYNYSNNSHWMPTPYV